MGASSEACLPAGHSHAPLGVRGPRVACLTSTPPRSPRTEDAPPAPGNRLVFSSYPGTIFSCDDFYILASGLVSVALLPLSPRAASPLQPWTSRMHLVGRRGLGVLVTIGAGAQ